MSETTIVSRRKWGKAHLYSAILASIFAVTIFTACNPIWGYAGVDSACFVVVGRGMLQGLVPYVDLIDNKGPVLYVLNALAQMPFIGLEGAASTIGIWLVELICLFCSLRTLDWMCKKLKCRWSAVIQVLYLLLLLPLIESGNMGEEYSNFFALLAFASVLKFEYDTVEKRMWQYGLYLGVLFTLCFFIRPNNALPIAAVVLVLTVGLCIQKRFKVVWISVLSFMLGVVIVLGPIVLYLFANDAVGDWLQQTIFVNLQYSGDAGNSFTAILFSQYGLTAASMFIFTIIGVLLAGGHVADHWKRNFSLVATGFAGVLSFYSAFISGFTFFHYLMVGTVPLIVSAIFISSPRKKNLNVPDRRPSTVTIDRLQEVCSAALCIFVVMLAAGQLMRIPGNARGFLPALKNYTLGGGYQNSELIQMSAMIPDEEKDSFYIMDSGSTNNCNYYVQTKLLPSFRAFIAVDRFIRLMPKLEEEYNAFFAQTPPKWIINDIPLDQLPEQQVRELLQNDYQSVYTTGHQVTLYAHAPKN